MNYFTTTLLNLGGYKMLNNIEIYKEILVGKRKRFPKRFWVDNGKENARIIFKYLIEEILQLSQVELLNNFNYDTVSQYKLTAPYDRFYNQCIGNLIKDIYPNLIKGKNLPMREVSKIKMSIIQKNLSPEKRERITKGSRENRYTKEYAKKLSDTKLGEINPQHKLKTEQVIEIKELWSTGIYTTASLGEKYKISRQSIADIVYGRTWKHV